MSKYFFIILSVVVLNSVSSSFDEIYAKGGDKGYCMFHYELQNDPSSICYRGTVPRMP